MNRSESPALVRTEAAAFEVKFRVARADVPAIAERLRRGMNADAHGDPANGGAYAIATVYLDTPGADVYRRTPGFRVRKYRVRRYGADALVYLERKSKRGEQVRKRRVAVSLADAESPLAERGPDWPGVWFAEEIARRGLVPACQVLYRRYAFVADGPTGPLRATIDVDAVGGPTTGFVPDPSFAGQPFLNGEAIVEFKFLEAMPLFFKEIVAASRWTPSAGSKYRRCAGALGLVAEGGQHG